MNYYYHFRYWEDVLPYGGFETRNLNFLFREKTPRERWRVEMLRVNMWISNATNNFGSYEMVDDPQFSFVEPFGGIVSVGEFASNQRGINLRPNARATVFTDLLFERDSLGVVCKGLNFSWGFVNPSGVGEQTYSFWLTGFAILSEV